MAHRQHKIPSTYCASLRDHTRKADEHHTQERQPWSIPERLGRNHVGVYW